MSAARFISVDNGWVNLDRVARVAEVYRPGQKHRPLAFYSKDGEVLGTLSFHHEFNLEELTSPIIPAAQGQWPSW